MKIKNKKAFIGLIVLIILLIPLFYFLLTSDTSTKEELTEEEQKTGMKQDVKIYDLYWKAKSGTSIFNPDSAYGRTGVIRFFKYTSGQVNVEASFRDMTYGVMFINFFPMRHRSDTNEHNVKLVFKNGDKEVFIISETIKADQWSNFKILFNGEIHQHRLYVNDKQIYKGHSYIYRTSEVNNVEIISDGYFFSLYTQFESLIGYEMIE